MVRWFSPFSPFKRHCVWISTHCGMLHSIVVISGIKENVMWTKCKYFQQTDIFVYARKNINIPNIWKRLDLLIIEIFYRIHYSRCFQCLDINSPIAIRVESLLSNKLLQYISNTVIYTVLDSHAACSHSISVGTST